MKEPQSWVTFASDDCEGLKALILSRSLRHVITRRQLTVFVSQNVSEEISELLELGFDRCFRITNNYRSLRFPGLKFDSVAKVMAFRLNKLDRFVFLDPNSMALRNADELFTSDKLMMATSTSESNSTGKNGTVLANNGDSGRISMFVGIPMEKRFKGLMKAATNPNGNFEFRESKKFETICGLVPASTSFTDKYWATVNFRHLDTIPGDIGSSRIVHFVGGHPLDLWMEVRNGHPTIEEEYPLGSLPRTLYDTCMDHLPAHDLEWLVKEGTLKFPSHVDGKMRHLLDKVPLPLEFLDELRNSVAIIGMGVRLPKANSLSEFWDLMIQGQDGIGAPPPGRWAGDRVWVRPDNAQATHAGFLTCPVDEIDGKFFGLSPLELNYMDPQQRLSLQVIWEALEHSGLNPTQLKGSNTGVYGGWWRHDYKEMLQESGLSEAEFFRSYMGNSLGTLTGRISHILDITGPSVSTESGCSTSIVAVDMATKALLSEDCDLALAFGVNLLLHPFSDQTLNSVIAPDGHCKTFDAGADGFGRAEGAVVLVLKRFPEAVRDGNSIHAVIRGSAVVQEGPSRSMGTPTKACEALAMTLALADAGVDAKDVSFVETHGTGTPVGDPLEMAAVTSAYGSQEREERLIIGSVKTNIGHTESCSGIAGIIKTVLSLQKEMIPPHRNFTELNPDIDLEAIPARLPLQAVPWPRREDKPRIAGVSSFGITGTDAHVILQESPLASLLPSPSLLAPSIETKTGPQILKLSAKSVEALEDVAASLKTYLKANKDLDFEEFIQTANMGRGDFSHRAFLVGKDRSDLIDQLHKKAWVAKQIQTQPADAPRPKLGFLFTGQGSQYAGMGAGLYESSPTFRFHFDVAAGILEKEHGLNIKNAMWGKGEEDINLTIYSQPSIFCVEYAVYKLWESLGISPDIVLGHSLGEFGAAVAAGALTLRDGLKLVAERSRLIQKLPKGSMVVLKKGKDQVEELLKESSIDLDYAAFNSPEQTVLAGTEETVAAFAAFCENNGVKTHILASSHAFHSRMMDPMLEEYRGIAQSVQNNKMSGPIFVSGMEGHVKDLGDINADYWVRHTREPVRFMDASATVLKEAFNFIEVGPTPVLSALLMMNADAVDLPPGEVIQCFPSLRRKENDWVTLYSSLGKLYSAGTVEIDWRRLYSWVPRRSLMLPSLPGYPFVPKVHWFDVGAGRNRPIHPLLGIPNPNPSSVKLYQSVFDLSLAPFIKDHKIGASIICPGAGFLEMALVAGHAAYSCLENEYTHPLAPISLEDFVIEAPLCIGEGERTWIHTSVSSEDSGDTKITIFSKVILDKETHKWIQHASALFSPYALDVKTESLETARTRCALPIEQTAEQTYDKLTEHGLRFGPAFRTIVTGWEDEGKTERVFQVQPTVPMDAYICHPVLVDAMFQSILLTTKEAKEALHVPVSVSKFVWLARLEGNGPCYIHTSTKVGSEDILAVLYDEKGKRLALMSGTVMLQTTASAVLSAVEAQRSVLPPMYELVWREELGTWERRMDALPDLKDTFPPEFVNSLLRFNDLNEEMDQRFRDVNDLCLAYVIMTLRTLGWTQDAFHLLEFMENLHISPHHREYVRHWLMELAKEGFLQVENLNFKVLKTIPSRESLESSISSLLLRLRPQDRNDISMLVNVGEALADILTSKVSGLSILFPEDGKSGSAESYYKESDFVQNGLEAMMPSIGIYIDTMLGKRKEGEIFRFLEVGAGTGAMTEGITSCIKERNPAAFHYTFTDLSPAFYAWSDKIFAGSRIPYVNKVLNIEEDPTAQGFTPHSFDVVLAGFVIHATEDVSKTLTHLRNLLRPGGLLVIAEFTAPLRPVSLSFGTLEGFWRFKDKDPLRPTNCELGRGQWERVLRETGFETVTTFRTYLDHAGIVYSQTPLEVTPFLSQPSKSKDWVVLTTQSSAYGGALVDKLKELGRGVRVIYKDSLTPETWEAAVSMNLEGVVCLWGLEEEDTSEENVTQACRPFLQLCQLLLSLESGKVVLVTQGLSHVGDWENSIPSSSPALSSMISTLGNENTGLACKYVDLELNTSVETGLSNLLVELFNSADGENAVVYRGNVRNTRRLLHLKPPNNKLTLPKGDRFRMILSSSNAIKDLKFGPAPPQESVMGEEDVEVKVRAYALNFRDLFVVLKPDPVFENETTMGLDLSGVVTRVGPSVTRFQVGDPVFGFNKPKEALPSHVVMSQSCLVALPERMTYAEAATLPVVATTAVVCLINHANIKEGETVLIHTGSGGVGLVAIQIAMAAKCVVVTTAGSNRKRAYLRSIGLQHVFHSRNTDYASKIKESLGGVDVVLNSLTGPGFKEATLSVLKPGGRFIEMSKLNVWTAEEVKVQRPDVSYSIVDLMQSSNEDIKTLISSVDEYVTGEKLSPIPYTRFDITDIREAMGYMQKARHIGKVVVVMPNNAGGAMPLFNDRSTYLVTGGLGGIGFEVAKWMVGNGAKHVVLGGRSPPSDKVADELKTLEEEAHVVAMQVDVGDLGQVETLLKSLKDSPDWPPLRGIMHAAGVLSDASYENQTWDKYKETFNPKILGGWNLHKLTLNCPLEHFVMFSSATAVLSPMGQSNHAAANAWLDSLAHYRHSMGLPATTVNWGQWGQVGVAANLEVIGLKPMSVLQGLSSLDTILKSSLLQTAVIEATMTIIRKAFPNTKSLLKELKDASTDRIEGLQVNAEDFWKEYDAAEEKIPVVKKYLRSIVRHILKLDEAEVMDDEGQLQDMGMDSLMMIEMKNVLQSVIGSRAKITVHSVKDCSTISQLATRLVELVSGVESLPIPTREELIQLMREDSTLPEAILSVQAEPSKPISKVTTVLITGVTGNLGPYVLREVLHRPQVTKVVCLTRKSNTKDKLEKLLRQKCLLTPALKERFDATVECLPGSLIEDHLGLPEKQYESLLSSVDAVFHLGVISTWQEIYRKAPTSEKDIRTVNVQGTLNLIRFACEKRLKHFYYPSSTLCATRLNGEGRIMEDWPENCDYDNAPNDAYFISKFIGELLLHQASESLGLPAKVIRMPMIGGDSTMGGSNTSPLNNQILLRTMSYMHLGSIPAVKVPLMIIPVDVCASLSLSLFFREGGPESEVYNLSNPFVNDELEFEEVAEELGHPVEVLEQEAFIKRLEKAEDKEVLVMVRKGLENVDFRERMEAEVPGPARAWMAGEKDVFLSRKVQEALPDLYPSCMETSLDILRRDLNYCKSSGIFIKLGLQKI